MQSDFSPHIIHFVAKQCDENWKLDHRTLPWCDLTFIIQGHATYVANGTPFVLSKGDAVFIHQGQTRSAGNADMQCAAFGFQYTSAQPLVLPPVIRWGKHPTLHTLLRSYQTERMLAEPGWEAKCRGLFLEIVCETWRCAQENVASPLVRQMERYIAQHLFEPITVQEIASVVGRHPNYCGAQFRKEKGCSILAYVHRLRLEHAVALMQEGDLSIGEIALQSGYNDIFYFSRMFKSFYGTAPSLYAETLRNPHRFTAAP